MPAPSPRSQPQPQAWPPAVYAVRFLVVVVLLYCFLVAIQLLSKSIGLMGADVSENFFEGVENPFAGLAVGVLATVLVQSSSTTTSTIVGMVGAAKGVALSVNAAVPMIMGANIGTTITNTLVSMGSVRRSQEFARAFAAATVHDFFNVLLVALLLPLELATRALSETGTGILAGTAEWLSGLFYGGTGAEFHSPIKGAIESGFDGIVGCLKWMGFRDGWLGGAGLMLGIVLTMVCLFLITKTMRTLISGPLERSMNKSLGRSGLIGILVGAGVTIAVQSSSITTSLLVPLCAAGVLTLENAFPMMLGANIGTTVTALLASMATDRSGLTIALVHTLFNVTGVLIFYPIPVIRNIPLRLARGLAERAARNPAWIVGYVVGFFVVIPLLGYLLFRSAPS